MIQKIIYSKPEGILEKAVALPLNVISKAYGPLVEFKLYLHQKGIFKHEKLPIKTISIGNITLGGTGKTPTTQYLAKFLFDKGFKPVILSRGYKRKGGEDKIKIVSDGEKHLLSPSESGDEPFLLSQNLKYVPVIVGRNRYDAGMVAIEKFKCNVALLDDGFQHFGLERDLDVVLVNRLNPFGNGYVFPRGYLREPLNALSRADVIIITKSDFEKNQDLQIPNMSLDKTFDLHTHKLSQEGNFDEIVNIIRKYNSDALIAKLIYKFTKLYGEGKELDLSELKDKKIFTFCGIADEKYFLSKLSQLVSEYKYLIFDDHHHYTVSDWENILRGFKEFKAELLITTQKDYYKIKDLFKSVCPISTSAPDLYYIGIETEIVENKMKLEERILETLSSG